MRYGVEVAYDGRPYQAGKRQPGLKTVQGDLERPCTYRGFKFAPVVREERCGGHARGSRSFDSKGMGNRSPVARLGHQPALNRHHRSRPSANLQCPLRRHWSEYVISWTASYCYLRQGPSSGGVQGDWASDAGRSACKAWKGCLISVPSVRERCPSNSIRRVLRVKSSSRHWAAFRIRRRGFLFHLVHIVGDLNRIAGGGSLLSFLDRLSGQT